MKVRELRDCLIELSDHVEDRMKQYQDKGMTIEQIALADPFLIGQADILFKLGVKMMGIRVKNLEDVI
jgi:hypothetical protein